MSHDSTLPNNPADHQANLVDLQLHLLQREANSCPNALPIVCSATRVRCHHQRRPWTDWDRVAEHLLALIRVLLADDFEAWRRRVRMLLERRPELQVVGEASDGSEAVQMAEDLKPDLILLDIGLPKLNGIEAARRIRQLSPNSKILFLSQNKELEVVEAALGTGALGYVYKMTAHKELLPAVDAVLRGKQFVSSGLTGRN
jgi:CheY-like chemotaxis protein